MKMISFELKKYVLKPSVLAFLILFAVLNLVKFFEIYPNPQNSNIKSIVL